jgi:tRNA modification GTPase
VIASGTIAAISTSGGRAGRIIVRISGERTHAIVSALLAEPLGAPGSAQLNRLGFKDLSFPIWVYLFGSPRSYTGEDLAELHVPGNPILAQWVLDQLFQAGARQAEPGEFTARAYFYRRMDLTEAEGVAATISASNEQELRAARQLMSGELSQRLRPVMDLVAETLSLIEVGLDFSDQDVTFLDSDQTIKRIGEAQALLTELLGQSSRFERLSHEPQIVLVGRPNAGKSTLLNALTGHERAVVSPIAGTTRDSLSAEVRLDRGMVRITDVAGLAALESSRDDVHGHIASRMQQQARRALQTADHVVLVTDITDPEPPPRLEREPDLHVFTKQDLAGASVPSTLLISAHTGAGMRELRAGLDTLAFGSGASHSALALNARHLQSIAIAQDALARARAAAPTAGGEIVALELREGLNALGQVLGEVSPDDLLGQIFASFCIGK